MFKDEKQRTEEKKKVLRSLRQLGEAKTEELRKDLDFQISGKTIGRYLSSSEKAEKTGDRLWRYRKANRNKN